MVSIREAVKAFPRDEFDGYRYPHAYARALLLTQPEWIPWKYREQVEARANTPSNARGKPRQRSADKGLVLWHAFMAWCHEQGEDVTELTVLLAEEYLARSGIMAPTDRDRLL